MFGWEDCSDEAGVSALEDSVVIVSVCVSTRVAMTAGRNSCRICTNIGEVEGWFDVFLEGLLPMSRK